ncbi:hypothetical protein AB5I41_28740 [Sphingomonas sp. MMS24-JH45]
MARLVTEPWNMEPITVTVEGAKKALGLGHTKIELIRDQKLKTVKSGAARW